jgi:hypothetical protein
LLHLVSEQQLNSLQPILAPHRILELQTTPDVDQSLPRGDRTETASDLMDQHGDLTLFPTQIVQPLLEDSGLIEGSVVSVVVPLEHERGIDLDRATTFQDRSDSPLFVSREPSEDRDMQTTNLPHEGDNTISPVDPVTTQTEQVNETGESCCSEDTEICSNRHSNNFNPWFVCEGGTICIASYLYGSVTKAFSFAKLP